MNETIYTRDGLRPFGNRVWTHMIANLINRREIIYVLMKRDIVIRYRQSILGFLWVILPQMVAACIFAYLQGKRMLPFEDTGLPYLLFAIWNLSIWQLFSGILVGATSSLVGAGPLVTKINFPKETLVFASLGQPIVDFAVRLALVIALFIWKGIFPPLQALFIPFLLLFILFLALGFGFILSIINLAIRDVGNGIGIVLTFSVFLAPILYPQPTDWPFVLINFNPITPLLIAMQDLLTKGNVTQPYMVLASCLFSLLIFLMGWRFFCLTIPRVVERA